MLSIAVAGTGAHDITRRDRAFQWAVLLSIATHLSTLAIVFAIGNAGYAAAPILDVNIQPPQRVVPMRIVFLPTPGRGAGGGGGGNRQSGPIRRAESLGHDRLTLRVAKPAITPSARVDAPTAPPGLVLDARPLASGMVEQIGLPGSGVALGTSTGSGSGGGVGDGLGTGIGSGRGPGVGPGSGGGTGGGPYHPGGAVTPPRILSQIKPRYTSEALSERLQGSVWLNLVVTREGAVDQLRVVRSLAPGLDDEATKAVRQWRFEPGRLAGAPVDVLVTVIVDFSIR